MVDPFGNDNLDSSHVLSRISPSLRQHLYETEGIEAGRGCRPCPCLALCQSRLSSTACNHAYESTYLEPIELV